MSITYNAKTAAWLSMIEFTPMMKLKGLQQHLSTICNNRHGVRIKSIGQNAQVRETPQAANLTQWGVFKVTKTQDDPKTNKAMAKYTYIHMYIYIHTYEHTGVFCHGLI